MTGQILTDVSATVDPDRELELLASFHELVAAPLPDGLLRTELMRGPENLWRIQTLWRSREALEAMLEDSGPPPARRLFHHVGAEPSLHIYEIEVSHCVEVTERDAG